MSNEVRNILESKSELLTEKNIQSIISYKQTRSEDQFRKFYAEISELAQYQLLTQENFNLIRNHKADFPEHIAQAFYRLKQLNLSKYKTKTLIVNSYRISFITSALKILAGINSQLSFTQADIEFIASYSKPEDFAQVLRTLNNLNLLTESNKNFFKENPSKINSVGDALYKIYQSNVYENKKLKLTLTQADFNVIKDHSKPADVAQALIILNKQGLLTDENRKAIKGHNKPCDIAMVLAQLNRAKISPKNIKVIKKQLNTVSYYHLSKALDRLKQADLLTQDNFNQLLAQTALCNAFDFWDRLRPHLLTQVTFEKFIELAEDNPKKPIDVIKEYADQLSNNKNVNMFISKSTQRAIPTAPPAEPTQRAIPTAPPAEPAQRAIPTAPLSCESLAMSDAPPPYTALPITPDRSPPPYSYQPPPSYSDDRLSQIEDAYKKQYAVLNNVITAISNEATNPLFDLTNEVKKVLQAVNETEREIKPNAINIANKNQQEKALQQYEELVEILSLITDILQKPEDTQLVNAHYKIINKIINKQCHTNVGERILSVLANAPIIGKIIQSMGFDINRHVNKAVKSTASFFDHVRHRNNTNLSKISCQA